MQMAAVGEISIDVAVLNELVSYVILAVFRG